MDLLRLAFAADSFEAFSVGVGASIPSSNVTGTEEKIWKIDVLRTKLKPECYNEMCCLNRRS
jgi:hypothetical protein